MRHRCARMRSLELHFKGAVHGRDYHNWFGYREERVPGSRRRCVGFGCGPSAAAARRAAEIFRVAAAVPYRDGGVRFGALLGSADGCVGAPGSPAAAGPCEALRKTGQEERRGRCGGDLRGGHAAADAERAGQERGEPSGAPAAPVAGSTCAPAHDADLCVPEPSGRVRRDRRPGQGQLRQTGRGPGSAGVARAGAGGAAAAGGADRRCARKGRCARR